MVTNQDTVSGKLAPFKKYKWRILAVTVFLVIFSPVAVVTYLSNREQLLDMDVDQWGLGMELSQDFPPSQVPPYEPLFWVFPKYYKVVLESIDDVQGTVHLRAELKTMTPDLKKVGLLKYIPEESKTDQNPVPAEVLFGRFTVHDENFASFAAIYPDVTGGVPRPTRNFSESAPTSTQADVTLYGTNPATPARQWWYPFDKYLIGARVDCVVVVTPDRKRYFRVLSDGYTLASKLPNFIVRNASAKDVEDWIKATNPDITDKDLKESTKFYRTDFWRDGEIRLVLTRPLFPRFLAVFFGIIALIWIGVVAKVSDPKQLSLNIFGYFLALWAIRAALAAGAPTGPLFIDYATLGLYALLIAVVAARFIWIRKT